MTYTIYILKCSDNSLYTGCTNDIKKRIKQHNESKLGAHYTKLRRPVVLMYLEVFNTLKKARQREAEIKSWSRKEKIALINKIFIE
ncbi:MAG: GIY-YIG nuclease family protein [bacterium]